LGKLATGSPGAGIGARACLPETPQSLERGGAAVITRDLSSAGFDDGEAHDRRNAKQNS
jgi:hypothetical protein